MTFDMGLLISKRVYCDFTEVIEVLDQDEISDIIYQNLVKHSTKCLAKYF